MKTPDEVSTVTTCQAALMASGMQAQKDAYSFSNKTGMIPTAIRLTAILIGGACARAPAVARRSARTPRRLALAGERRRGNRHLVNINNNIIFNASGLALVQQCDGGNNSTQSECATACDRDPLCRGFDMQTDADAARALACVSGFTYYPSTNCHANYPENSN